MNNSPGTALSDIDVVDTTASLIGSSNATLDEVSDNAESKANDIAINEAVRLRELLVGSLNPSFGPVMATGQCGLRAGLLLVRPMHRLRPLNKRLRFNRFRLVLTDLWVMAMS